MQTQSIPVPPEVNGYVQGHKDSILALVEVAAQNGATAAGLRAQLAQALATIEARDREIADLKSKLPDGAAETLSHD